MKPTIKMSKDQSRDTGMALVLLLLILDFALRWKGLLLGAVIVQVLNMIWPRLFAPIAVLWFGFSRLLGAISAKVLLSIVFLTVVTPMAILRRLLGKDTLKLRAFKSSKDSVMIVRSHTFIGADLEAPY